MDSMRAFMNGAAARAAGARMMVFDWEKAARLIVEHRAIEAEAGLAGDWEWTGGTILSKGQPDMESYTYLASCWATPELRIGEQTFDCWRAQDRTGWNASTKWPKSALAILGKKKKK